MSNECQSSNEECHFIILEFVIDLEIWVLKFELPAMAG